MNADLRAALARQAYLRALNVARVAPTPRRWRKLVAAAKALRVAERVRERRWLAAFPPAARRRAAAHRAAAAREAVVLQFPSRAAPGTRDAPVPAGARVSPRRGA